MQRATTLKRTPFHAFHVAAGARMIEFAGHEMPVRYTGEVREHRCVRSAAGLFDLSHMGEFRVAGDGAGAFLDRAVTNDVASLAVGQALYTPLCRPDGGIVDDLLVYRAPDDYLLVVNAANVAKDFAWLDEHRPAGVVLEDRSDATALLAVQGPRAEDVLRGHVPRDVLGLGHYRFARAPVFGADAIVSRTGYTGEDGFEIFFAPDRAAAVWEGLTAAGAAAGLEPAGLGARDTLRLEAAFRLYGNDMDDGTTPLEAGLGWTVKWAKGDFIGRRALVEQRERGLARKLVGFELDSRRVPRRGMAIEAGGRPAGRVTSGSFSPTLERPIGLGYVDVGLAARDTRLAVVAGEARLEARVVPLPFYRGGSRRTG